MWSLNYPVSTLDHCFVVYHLPEKHGHLSGYLLPEFMDFKRFCNLLGKIMGKFSKYNYRYRKFTLASLLRFAVARKSTIWII